MQQLVKVIMQGHGVGYFQQRPVALLSGGIRRGLGNSWHTAYFLQTSRKSVHKVVLLASDNTTPTRLQLASDNTIRADWE
jgi:hypothetical protein